jgi:hypothetical protein
MYWLVPILTMLIILAAALSFCLDWPRRRTSYMSPAKGRIATFSIPTKTSSKAIHHSGQLRAGLLFELYTKVRLPSLLVKCALLLVLLLVARFIMIMQHA